nr:RNA methyltransferase family protein [Tanacetum cinerariifolium]
MDARALKRKDAFKGERPWGDTVGHVWYEGLEGFMMKDMQNQLFGGRRLFPKRGEEVELVCESLAFKGKGLCKVEETGYVVMCDRALPGERFVGRVTRKKNNYSEVTKVKTLSPHNDMVEAPCEYASHCGGCRTQNLLYDAQVRAKEEQVRDLVVHVGKFSFKDPEFENVMKPIVPCVMQFHYRNKMEFSFGTKRWLPKEQLLDKSQDANFSSLGLHAPGFFDKSDTFDRDVETLLPQLMVNFVTSSYKPELLKPLVDKLTVFPEVVSIVNNINTSVGNTSVGEQEYTLYGKATITEILRGLAFEISANSFFQTNA